MITRLPPWVEYGAFVLAMVAGCINAVGLLGFAHQSVSHLSGTATLVGTSLYSLSGQTAHLVGILISFLLGAGISGLMLPGSSLKLGRHYDSLLLIEALLLLAATYAIGERASVGHYLASAACGLQNALASKYSGAVVRTTHLTGVFTDLGLMLGGWLRGDPFDRRKGLLFLLIISGFILGGTLGAWLFRELGFMALIAPASVCLVLAAVYRVYRLYGKPGQEEI